MIELVWLYLENRVVENTYGECLAISVLENTLSQLFFAFRLNRKPCYSGCRNTDARVVMVLFCGGRDEAEKVSDQQS